MIRHDIFVLYPVFQARAAEGRAEAALAASRDLIAQGREIAARFLDSH